MRHLLFYTGQRSEGIADEEQKHGANEGQQQLEKKNNIFCPPPPDKDDLIYLPAQTRKTRRRSRSTMVMMMVGIFIVLDKGQSREWANHSTRNGEIGKSRSFLNITSLC